MSANERVGRLLGSGPTGSPLMINISMVKRRGVDGSGAVDPLPSYVRSAGWRLLAASRGCSTAPSNNLINVPISSTLRRYRGEDFRNATYVDEGENGGGVGG